MRLEAISCNILALYPPRDTAYSKETSWGLHERGVLSLHGLDSAKTENDRFPLSQCLTIQCYNIVISNRAGLAHSGKRAELQKLKKEGKNVENLSRSKMGKKDREIPKPGKSARFPIFRYFLAVFLPLLSGANFPHFPFFPFWGSHDSSWTYEWQRKYITKIHANLVLQASISFLRCFKRRESKDTQAVSYLVLQACISFFEVFQTRAMHSCFCLVRIKCRCSYEDQTEGWCWITSELAGVPLQNLVMKLFPEYSPILLCSAVGILGWNCNWSLYCSEYSRNKPENFAGNFGPNFAPDCPPPKGKLRSAETLC